MYDNNLKWIFTLINATLDEIILIYVIISKLSKTKIKKFDSWIGKDKKQRCFS